MFNNKTFGSISDNVNDLKLLLHNFVNSMTVWTKVIDLNIHKHCSVARQHQRIKCFHCH